MYLRIVGHIHEKNEREKEKKKGQKERHIEWREDDRKESNEHNKNCLNTHK